MRNENKKKRDRRREDIKGAAWLRCCCLINLINLSNDIVSRVQPFAKQSVGKFALCT